MNDKTTLVATLGGQPQVVTFTLDLLLARGEPIGQVVIVYMASGPRYREAYRRLAGEFIADRYRGAACRLRHVAIRQRTGGSGEAPNGEAAIADAITPSEVEAVRASFYQLFAELKAQGQALHLSLSGGRRIMALTALAAATQHFTPADHIWHIYTPPELTEQAREGAILHAPPEAGVRLIEVPFVPWAAYFPGLKPLLDERPPLFAWLDGADLDGCRRVWDALTPRQRDVLRLLAQGHTSGQIGARLCIRPGTVDDHRKAILAKCAAVWDGGADDGGADDGGVGEGVINLAFLRRQFGPFLSQVEQL